MDLALEFGMPAEELARRMSEREFRQWVKRAKSHWLPGARAEFYLAQIARLIAVTMGGVKDSTISDFMLDLEPAGEPEDEVEVAREAFGFSPRKRKNVDG